MSKVPFLWSGELRAGLHGPFQNVTFSFSNTLVFLISLIVSV